MVKYNIFTMIIGIFISFMLIFYVRKSKLNSTRVIWWTAVITVITVFSLFPKLINFMAYKFGIAYPPTLIIVVGICVILIKIMRLDIYTTNNEIRYKQLMLKVSILEKELNELRSENKKDKDSNTK